MNNIKNVVKVFEDLKEYIDNYSLSDIDFFKDIVNACDFVIEDYKNLITLEKIINKYV